MSKITYVKIFYFTFVKRIILFNFIMKDRILQFLRSENKTSSQFAEEIGVQASSISHIISGRNKPSLDFIIKMLQQYDELSTDWLIFGKGEMFRENTASDLFSETTESSYDRHNSNLKDSINQSSENEHVKTSEKIISEMSIQSKSPVQRVILIYSDNTFREFNPA